MYNHQQNINSMELTDKARIFAIAAHSAVQQRRKYTGEEYYRHPIAVSELVKHYAPDHTEEMVAASLLHDVVEDCNITVDLISREFGAIVADYVYWLSDVSQPSDGNRTIRKEMDRQHIANAPPAAKTIKLADILDNCRSIGQHDPEFSIIYFEEKRRMLEVLTDGNAVLWKMVQEVVNQRNYVV